MKYLLLLLVFSFSCTKITTLNMKQHHFNDYARHIVFLNVPGLDTDHLAWLKFQESRKVETLNLEKFTCLGNIWSYNIHKIRPNPDESFLAQITGNSNITDKCNNLDLVPIWNYFEDRGVRSFYIERRTDHRTSSLDKCDKGHFFDKVTSIYMAPNAQKNRQKFHYQNTQKLEIGTQYYDVSCKKNCLSGYKNNFKTIMNSIGKRKRSTFFTIRDFRIREALYKNDFKKAKEVLLVIDQFIKYIYSSGSRISGDTLIVVSSSGSLGLDFPISSKGWFDFNENGKILKRRNTRLISPVFAKGPGAENFCGIYEEKGIFGRLFWRPQRREFNIIPRF